MIELLSAGPTFDDPLGMLRACHRRIERALMAIQRVVELERIGALDERARKALRDTLEYFEVGVPRHSADEEDSLFPRMREAPGGADEGPSMHVIAAEHGEAAALHEELAALAADVVETGRFTSDERRSRFAEVAAALHALYAEHIRREDDEVFPAAARALTAEDLEAVGSDMAARRGIDWSRQRETVAQLSDRPWVRGQK